MTIMRHEVSGWVTEPFPAGLPITMNLPVIDDFDGDGHADLATGPYNALITGQLRIYWGEPGVFPGSTFSFVTMPGFLGYPHLTSADMDNDGDADLLFSYDPFSFFDSGNRLFLNQGNRSFVAANDAVYPPAQASEADAFPIDIDGDGWRDVLLVSRDAPSRILWNNAGTFALATPAELPPVTNSL